MYETEKFTKNLKQISKIIMRNVEMNYISTRRHCCSDAAKDISSHTKKYE